MINIVMKKLLFKIIFYFSPERTCIIHKRNYPEDYIIHYKYIFKKRYIIAKTHYWHPGPSYNCRCSLIKIDH